MPTLPSPGFDADSFDSSFDTTEPNDPQSSNSGVTNQRKSEEWYICDRCGWYYPRSMMMNQNGLNLCQGAQTRNCVDLPGHSAAERLLDVPYEERPEPLPNTDEEL